MGKTAFIMAFLLAAAAGVASAAQSRPIKACVMQPPYSYDTAKIGESVQWEIDALARCDESLDLIVLPEASDRQGAIHSPEELADAYGKYNARLLAACAETARRCRATLFVNALDSTPSGMRNTTFAYDGTGRLVGKYDKAHLVRSEHAKLHLDASYMWEWSEPTIMEIDGIRYAFLTCYDFYFYEAFGNIARYRPDVVIGCSHQRSDRHDALEMFGRFVAYNTAAYLVRASVSMGPDSPLGGSSMVVSPMGQILGNMYSKVGTLTVEFDVKAKYLKPAGYGNPPDTHPSYIEIGRRPWKYRPAGSAIVPGFGDTPLARRLGAAEGLASAAPDGRLAALGAAVAVGAPEISFAVSSGSLGEFEKILRRLSCHALMDAELEGVSADWSDAALAELARLVRAFDARLHVCFVSGDATLLGRIAAAAPSLARAYRCADGESAADAVAAAKSLGCGAVEFSASRFGREEADRARASSLRSMVAAPSAKSADGLFAAGADTVLVPDYPAGK